jgi:hypothetical protein
MPWVYRYKNKSDLKSRFSRWSLDHREELVNIEIGIGVVAIALAVVLFFLTIV